MRNRTLQTEQSTQQKQVTPPKQLTPPAAKRFALGLLGGAIAATMPGAIAAAIPGAIAAETVPAPAERAEQYIDMTYTGGDLSDFPGNLTDIGGWIVYHYGSEEPLEWAISEVTDDSTDSLLLFFNREIDRDGNQAVWQVRDAVRIPMEIASGRLFETLFIYNYCALDGGEPDPEVFAVLDSTEEMQFLPATDYAWRANRSTGELEPLPVEDVLCENPAWGV